MVIFIGEEMKKYVLFLIVFLVPITAFAWLSDGVWIEHECTICGKSIYRYQESQIYPYMPSVTIFEKHGCPIGGAKSKSFDVISQLICADCYGKYQKQFFAIIDDFYSSIRDDVLIKKHASERQTRRIKEKEGRILKLKKEVDMLKKR